MKRIHRGLVPVSAAALAAALAASVLPAGEAWAGSKRLAASNPTWQSECGSCHVAYPPALLPAAEWRRLMGALEKHFGVDASVDASTAAQIERFLVSAAGRGEARAPEAEPRISTTRWFEREHRKVAPGTFRSAAVKTVANCGACHPGAAGGDYDEDAVRIPK